MSDDYDDMGGVPPCDQCDSPDGALWCEKCSVVLCNECGSPEGKHANHPIGTIGTSDDAYAYDEDDDAAVANLPPGDEPAAFIGGTGGGCAALEDALGLDGPAAGGAAAARRPRGVIDEYVTEDEAYHVVEMLESNAHISCRKLLKPVAGEALRDILRDRREPETMSRAAYGPDEPVRLSAEQWASLANTSYVVIDDFVPWDVAMAARAQTLELVQQGLLTEYKNPKDFSRDHSARSDLRTFLKADDTASPASTGPLSVLVRRLEELRAALAEGVKLTGEQHEYQLAYYGAEGQHYKKHRDAFPNDGSRQMTGQVGRRVTCTLYMNEYEEAHGGKLRLHVPDSSFNSETVLDVAPVAGRAVLFLSGAMDHEVLPSFAPRCAMAAWYS